jgi:hypothetical protein
MGKIWFCKIGEIDADRLPDAADWPMRKAIAAAYLKITGQPDDFIFSGWDGELTELQRAIVEDRSPTPARPCPGIAVWNHDNLQHEPQHCRDCGCAPAPSGELTEEERQFVCFMRNYLRGSGPNDHRMRMLALIDRLTNGAPTAA